MNKLGLFLAFFIGLFFCGFAKHVHKSFPLNQIDKTKQIIQDHQGQVYLLSDHRACAFGTDGIEDFCLDFDHKIKELIIFEQDQSALAVENEIQLYKQRKLQEVITLSETIHALAYDKNRLFIGTSDGTLWVYNLKNKKLDTLRNFDQTFINDLLVVDSSLWVALDHGLSVFSTQTLVEKHQLSMPNSIINRLLETQNSGVYAFGEFGDLYWFSSTVEELAHRKININLKDATSSGSSTYLLSNDACYELKADLSIERLISGNYTAIYALSNQLLLAGENVVHSLDVTQEKIDLVDNCYSIYAENDNSLWVGGQGVVYLIENDSLKKTIDLPGIGNDVLSVSAIYVSDQYIFAGTMGEGLFVLNKSGDLIKQLLIEEDNNQKNIIQMQFKNNSLWVAYLNGVITFDVDELKPLDNHSEIIGSNYLYSINSLGDDEFFAGTSVHGLLYFKEGELTNFLPNRSIFSIEQTKDVFYVSTENDGIYYINRSTLKAKQISSQNKAFSIHQIGEQLLIAGENDLVLLDIENKNRFDLPNVGLDKMQFNSTATSENYIFIGYANGILKIDKEKLKSLSKLPIYLSLPQLFDQTVIQNKESFEAEENTFTFSFQTFNYYKPENTFYKYRLLGLDSSWQLTGQTFVNYYNLPHGQYTFQVAAGTSDDFIPQTYSTYTFSIARPFWMQPLFIISMVLCLGFFIFLFIKWRERQIVAQGKIEQERMRFEFDQLKNQVDPHFLFNSLNSIIDLIEEDPDTAIDAVGMLSKTYRSILEYGKIDTIDLKTELKLAEQYFQIHKLRYQHLIQLNITEMPIELNYRLLPLSLQFLIENAIKHNQINRKHQLKVDIFIEGDYLVVENQVNFKKQAVPSTALGLINLKKRYAQLTKKEVVIIENQNKFTVKLPLIYG
jgi:ligand-binding sensor domain-containing protein